MPKIMSPPVKAARGLTLFGGGCSGKGRGGAPGPARPVKGDLHVGPPRMTGLTQAVEVPVRRAFAYHRNSGWRFGFGFDACPNWRSTQEWLATVLEELGLADVEIAFERIESPEDADRLRFVGSPTILIDGRDVFPLQEGQFGLTCRIYETPDGLAGSPTADQLRLAVRHAV